MAQPRPFGFWPLMIGGGILAAVFVAGQSVAVVDYERVVAWGLQEPVNDIGITGLAFNLGFAFADTLFYVPILIAGLWSLWHRKAWGLPVMAAALGVSVYWPLVCTAALIFGHGQPGFGYPAATAYLPLTGGSFVYGVWGLWYTYSRRAQLFTSEA